MMKNKIIWLKEETARKGNKFYPREFSKAENYKPGQPILHQAPQSKKLNSGFSREKFEEPQSYSIEANNGASYLL